MSTNTSYVPVPNTQNPNGAQGPFSLENLNAIGSTLAAEQGWETTSLIKQAIQREIFRAIPSQFKPMKLLFSRPMIWVSAREFKYYEQTWHKVQLKATAGVGSSTSMAIPITPASITSVTVNNLVYFEDNSMGIVSEVNTGTNTITVKAANNGSALPAISSGDALRIQSPLIGDGLNVNIQFDRLGVYEKRNQIQIFKRNKKWTRGEQTTHRNNGVTDYVEKDTAMLAEQLYTDAFSIYLNGTMGVYNIYSTNGGGVITTATTADGIYPALVKGGCQHGVADPVTLKDVFKQLANNTNYKNVDEPRFILATQRMLGILSDYWKDPVRYAPNDTIASLDLRVYEFMGMKFVPIAVELMKTESNMFPTEFNNKIIVLDMSAINPVCWTGYQPFEESIVKLSVEEGGYNDWKEWGLQGCLSTQLNNVAGHFYLDIVGV